MPKFIYQRSGWPKFRWDNETIIPVLGRVRNMQGRLAGRMEAIGFSFRDEASLETVTLDVVKSGEIEGEKLDADQVRSSVARHLGMDIAGLVPSDRNVDGVVEMTLDAIKNYNKPLTKKRICSWHASLFPSGMSGMLQILTGRWRDDSTGPMQVISGPLGREKVHFQAPPATDIEKEMNRFLEWFNSESGTEIVLKAGVAHLWFVTVHPFEDGNGRIARVLTDMLLSRADGTDNRYYSMSAQIRRDRKRYYEILEKTQGGSLDITGWLIWFLQCMEEALKASEKVLSAVLFRAEFWNRHSQVDFNDRQRFMLNRLMEDFRGKLTTSKWAKMTGSSADSALRDIRDLLEKKILTRDPSGGRSTSYSPNTEPNSKSEIPNPKF